MNPTRHSKNTPKPGHLRANAAAMPVNFNLSVSVFKEDGQFVAYSPTLDLSTCGDSLEHAQQNFSELVVLFFEELAKMGTTEEVLSSLGWQRKRQQWNPPTEVFHAVETFHLPVSA